MTSSVKVVIHEAAVRELLTSAAVQSDLERRGAGIAAACNADSTWGGYESGPVPGDPTAKVNVWSIGADDDEARRNRLVRNLDAGA
jgi:hypothetical protein